MKLLNARNDCFTNPLSSKEISYKLSSNIDPPLINCAHFYIPQSTVFLDCVFYSVLFIHIRPLDIIWITESANSDKYGGYKPLLVGPLYRACVCSQNNKQAYEASDFDFRSDSM